MSHQSTAVRLLAAATFVAVAACSDGTRSTGPEPTPVLRTAKAPDIGTLARTVPGFGGLFIDNGVPTVYLTDVTKRGAAERALGAFAQGRGFAPGDIRVLQGRYAYGELDRWTQAVSYEAFDQGGLVFGDLDQAADRVLLRVR